MKREAGVLCAVSSLPGSFGVGDIGDAYRFVDYLTLSGAKIWQILPLNPLGYGNSPYQTYSSFAGDEIYISIELLYKELKLSLNFETVKTSVALYDCTRSTKHKLLVDAFKHFKRTSEYNQFTKKAFWLDEYTKFMTLRKENNLLPWTNWTKFYVDENEVDFQKFLQYVFYKQWQDLKRYANKNGIKIMGDIPIYLGHDSAEVYFNKEWFYLNEDGSPKLVAGVPPDYFSDDGQLWGNPIYNWDVMKQTNYDYWINRLRWNQELFDVIRLDHFRAFDTYWIIPGDSQTARVGEWKYGPSNDFFNEVYQRIADIQLVVEDLGDLRPEVLKLRDDYNMMGMQIIQFALKSEEIVRDKTMRENILIYTGTHDNQPLGGWEKSNSLIKKLQVRLDIAKTGIKEFSIIDTICHYTLSLNALWVILPLQDLLRLDSSATMNSPGTVGSPNWEWKLEDYDKIEKGFKRFSRWLKKTKRY